MSLAENINHEFGLGPDPVDVLDIRAREIVLKNLKPIPVSQDFSPKTFYGHTDLEDLFSENDKGEFTQMLKFEEFLRESDLGVYIYLVTNVVRKIAYPKVYGRPVSTGYLKPTIKDAKELISTGAIEKLDGFNSSFNLEVAKRLFS